MQPLTNAKNEIKSIFTEAVEVTVVVVVVIGIEGDPVLNSTVCLCVTRVQELVVEWLEVVC